MRVARAIAVIVMVLAVAGCTAVEVGAPYEDIARARHVPQDEPYVAVMSMISTRTGRAEHTGLIVNGSERVVYDPAGTFTHRDMPERGDVHYGATDRLVSYYKRYHARLSHYVHEQKIPVSRGTADAVIARMQRQGPTHKAFCTIDTIDVLNDVPAIPAFERSLFPESLRKQVEARVPDVIDSYVYEEDRDKAIPDA